MAYVVQVFMSTQDSQLSAAPVRSSTGHRVVSIGLGLFGVNTVGFAIYLLAMKAYRLSVLMLGVGAICILRSAVEDGGLEVHGAKLANLRLSRGTGLPRNPR